MTDLQNPDLAFMEAALELARQAGARGEVPVGAVVVYEGRVIGTGENRRETMKSAVSHAEIYAIEEACKNRHAWRLSDCTLYVTLEPCLMCAGAIYQARLARVVFGTTDPKAGALGSLFRLHEDTRLNHRYVVQGGLLADESQRLLKDFFKARRSENVER